MGVINRRHRSGNYVLGAKGTASHTASSALKAIGIPFFLVGLFLIGLCIAFIYNDSTYDDKYERVNAKIVDITSHKKSDGNKSYNVYVSYEYDGSTFERMPINLYTSSMRVGQSIEVYITPDDPGKTHVKTGMFAGVILAILGVVFGGVGVGLIIAGSGGNVKKRLVDNGQGEQVYATVTFAGNSNVTVNNMRTYRIKATWDAPDGFAYEFKSELLYFDPSIYISEGELIRVYVDPNNYKKYYMCAQELQSEDPEYQQYSGY